jgi:hypothetical protein
VRVRDVPRVLIPPPRPSRARRAWGAALLVGLSLAASLAVFAQPPVTRPSSLDERVWRFADTPFGPLHAVILTPREAPAAQRFPLLIALHGWGESQRGPERGAWGWARDYELGASDRALRARPLARESFLGCLTLPRFRQLRDDLAARPYRGMVVVTPYTPDLLDEPERATRYARWLAEVLVPRARRELPVLAGRAATGVDGVSLGGLLALEAGFAHPEVFGVVGALQPAVRRRIPRVLSRLRAGAPPQRLRLLTSDRDYLRPDVRALHRALASRRVAHELVEVAGPHDYVFNRGAGGLEMLLFHDRALRGEPAR